MGAAQQELPISSWDDHCDLTRFLSLNEKGAFHAVQF